MFVNLKLAQTLFVIRPQNCIIHEEPGEALCSKNVYIWANRIFSLVFIDNIYIYKYPAVYHNRYLWRADR